MTERDEPGEIVTARLVLRPVDRSHAEAFVGFYGDPEVMSIRKFGVLDRARALGQVEKILAHWHDHGFGLNAVIRGAAGELGREFTGECRGECRGKFRGEFMGECGLRWLEDRSDVELSYGLLPAYRGQGYATEAATASIDHGLSSLGLDRIVALSRGDNHASHRVLEKCGMRRLWRREAGEHALVKYVIER